MDEMMIGTLPLGMHIMEGFLPVGWALGWALFCIPFLIYGLKRVGELSKSKPNIKLILAMVGAFAFVLSALKLPSVSGSCSHPTGVALGAILFGAGPMVLVGMIVLLFQALLLAHGGITTLGANMASMAVVGPFIAWGVFAASSSVKVPLLAAVFLAACLSDIGTYCVTSFQLGFAHPDAMGGVWVSTMKFMGVFAITQIPLAIAEGLLSAFVFNLLLEHSREEMDELGFRPDRREAVSA